MKKILISLLCICCAGCISSNKTSLNNIGSIQDLHFSMVFTTKCDKCGADNDDSHKFCEKCGAKLKSNKSKEAIQTKPKDTDKETSLTYWNLHGNLFIPQSAEILKLDPFYGAGISYLSINPKSDSMSIFSFEFCKGKGIIEIEYSDGTTDESTFDDMLFFFMYDYVFLFERKGPIKRNNNDKVEFSSGGLMLGIGLAIEIADIENEDADFISTGVALPLDIGLGYFSKSVNARMQYVFLPGSGNVTGALLLSFGISF